jgi:hypothetical protein
MLLKMCGTSSELEAVAGDLSSLGPKYGFVSLLERSRGATITTSGYLLLDRSASIEIP